MDEVKCFTIFEFGVVLTAPALGNSLKTIGIVDLSKIALYSVPFIKNNLLSTDAVIIDKIENIIYCKTENTFLSIPKFVCVCVCVCV
jgi:hypothetical protein